MTTIPMNTKGAVDHGSLSTINRSKVQGIFSLQNIQTLNRPSAGSAQTTQLNRPSAGSAQTTQRPASAPAPSRMPPQAGSQSASSPQDSFRPQPQQSAHAPAAMPQQAGSQPPAKTPAPSSAHAPTAMPPQTGIPRVQTPAPKRLPAFLKPVQKGQKIPLSSGRPPGRLTACFGWNTTNAQCDVDVSAFLLGADGRVLGDSWFVFYGQTKSPDSSCTFQSTSSQDRETITIDFHRLHPDVKKIVFVLTINEAFEKNLHFGMMKDAYIRILGPDQKELASFQMTEYYTNVISMMIGEIYDYNGTWKFHAVGNGVAKDLAGLCSLYGVQVCD